LHTGRLENRPERLREFSVTIHQQVLFALQESVASESQKLWREQGISVMDQAPLLDQEKPSAASLRLPPAHPEPICPPGQSGYVDPLRGHVD
jgi:hypothetical protein